MEPRFFKIKFRQTTEAKIESILVPGPTENSLAPAESHSVQHVDPIKRSMFVGPAGVGLFILITLPIYEALVRLTIALRMIHPFADYLQPWIWWTANTVAPYPLLILTTIYFLPSLLALSGGHKNSVRLFAVNLIAGWTVIGWLIAMKIACSTATYDDRRNVIRQHLMLGIVVAFSFGAATTAKLPEHPYLAGFLLIAFRWFLVLHWSTLNTAIVRATANAATLVGNWPVFVLNVMTAGYCLFLAKEGAYLLCKPLLLGVSLPAPLIAVLTTAIYCGAVGCLNYFLAVAQTGAHSKRTRLLEQMIPSSILLAFNCFVLLADPYKSAPSVHAAAFFFSYLALLWCSKPKDSNLNVVAPKGI